jgi:hypothetical protein
LPLYSAFGLLWHSDIPLWQFESATCAAPPDITVSLAGKQTTRRTKLLRRGNVTLCEDGVRYCAGEVATIDIFGADRILVTPGRAWDGVLPQSFFSTVTALVLAAAGLVPMHATAVEIAGQRVLISGRPGAGKSTLGAALIGLGGQLISDDLSVLRPVIGKKPLLSCGRRTIRLYPRAAEMLGAARGTQIAEPDERGKQLYFSKIFPCPRAVELDHVVFMDIDSSTAPRNMLADLVHGLVFRPRILSWLPGCGERRAALAKAAAQVSFLRVQEFRDCSAETCLHRARALLADLGLQDG